MISDGTVSGSESTLQNGDTVTWFAVPADGDAGALASSANGVTGVTSSFAVTDRMRRPHLAYETADSQDTLIAALPHQFASLRRQTDATSAPTRRSTERCTSAPGAS